GFHRATNPSSKAPEPPLDAGCSFLGGPRAQRVASAALHGARLDPSERCPPRRGYVPRASASAAAARRSGSGSCWLVHERVGRSLIDESAGWMGTFSAAVRTLTSLSVRAAVSTAVWRATV